MNWEESGLDKSLQRPLSNGVKPYTPGEIDRLFTDIPGNKIFEYLSTNFIFIPTTPSANPKEGELYYDKEDKKLKIFTGTEYETIQSDII